MANGPTVSRLEGVIAGVEFAPEGTRLTVDPPDTSSDDRAVVIVPPEAKIEVQRADGDVRGGSAADLVAGARIVVRHTGAQLRSLPPQYVATEIRVLPGS